MPPLVSLGRPGLSCPETDRRWKDAGCHTASCPALPGSTTLTSELSSADSVQRYESHSWLFSFFSFFFLKTKLDKLILDTTIWKWNSTVGETQTFSFQNLLQSYHKPVWHWHTDRHVDQQEHGCVPRNKPLHLRSAEFQQSAKTIWWERWSLQHMVLGTAGQLDVHTQKDRRWVPSLKTDSEWITDLNVSEKTIKPLEENRSKPL